MEGKKIKFELSRLALIFVILFALCLLVWTFILGVWIGTKIGGKPVSEEVALEREVRLPSVGNLTSNVSDASQAPLVTANETSNATQNATSEKQVAEEKEELRQTSETEKKAIVKKEPVKKEVTKKEELKKETEKTEKKPSYQKKEVAQIAAKVKGEEAVSSVGHYSLQVGAFSHKEKAEELKKKAEKMGYFAQIKEANVEGKSMYKVYVGRFGKREEAEQSISEVKAKLGVEKPFIVELK